jgi:gamma-glutamyltranspeptidase
VVPVIAHHWKNGLWQVSCWLSSDDDTDDTATTNKPTPVPLTVIEKHAPEVGEIFTNTEMARVLRNLCRDGAKAGFYEGQTGKAIAEAVQTHGGTLTLQDLRHHTSLAQEPICVEYRVIELWQMPPNRQGVAGMIALAGLQHLEEKKSVSRHISRNDWIGRRPSRHNGNDAVGLCRRSNTCGLSRIDARG